MLWTGSLYALLVEISLADTRLSLPPNIDEIPQLEPVVLPDKHQKNKNRTFYNHYAACQSHKKDGGNL